MTKAQRCKGTKMQNQNRDVVRSPWKGKAVSMAKLLGILVLFLGFAGYGIRTVDEMNGPEPGDPTSLMDYNDFNVGFRAGERLLAEKEFYFEPTSKGRYFLYPPIFALYMSLLVKLGLRGAAVYWYLTNLFMLLMSAYLIASVLTKAPSTRVTLALLGILLTGRFIDSDFGNGNANCHVLFFIALGLWCLAKNRSFWGGAAVAIATLIKVTPIIFIGYFSWKFVVDWLRKRKVFPGQEADRGTVQHLSWIQVTAGMVVTLFLLTAVVPTLFLGWSRSRQLHQDYYNSMVGPYLEVSDHPEKFWDAGYSMKAMLVRYLTERPDDHYGNKPLQINFVHWSSRSAWLLYLFISLVMVAISLVAWRSTGGGHLSEWQRLFLLTMEVGNLVALMVTISPLSRKAHFVVLLIPVIVFLRTGFKPLVHYVKQFRTFLVGTAVVVGLIGVGSSIDVVGSHMCRILDAHCFLGWAPIIVWASSTIVLLRLCKWQGDKEIDINTTTGEMT